MYGYPSNIFPVGVFMPEAISFDLWKLRGINTVCEVPLNHDPVEWSARAVARGLRQTRAPIGDLKADAQTPLLVAWAQHDEPELNGITPAQCLANFNIWQAAAPTMPVYINFSGGDIVQKKYDYAGYAKAGTLCCMDIYPVTGWGQPAWLDKGSADYDKWSIGAAMDQLAGLAAAKPTWAFIEASNQKLAWVPNNRSVTADEFRGEVWSAIMHGAQGIVYFPEQIGPFAFDAVPADVEAEMKTTNAGLQKNATLLNSRHPCAWWIAGPGSETIEACESWVGTDRINFALNMSHKPCVFRGVTFPPFGVAQFKNNILVTQYPAPTPVQPALPTTIRINDRVYKDAGPV